MKYILTGVIFGIIYELARLEFSIDALLAGVIIGGITGGVLTLFAPYIDKQRAYNELNPMTIKQYAICSIAGVSMFIFLYVMVILWP